MKFLHTQLIQNLHKINQYKLIDMSNFYNKNIQSTDQWTLELPSVFASKSSFKSKI